MDYETAFQLSPLGRAGFLFVKGDNFTGIDLDNCILEDGTLHPVAREIIEIADSYTEISTSGKGVKIWIRGEKPHWMKCQFQHEGQAIEVYSELKWFLTTFNRMTPQENVTNGWKVLAHLANIAPKPTAYQPANTSTDPADPHELRAIAINHPPAISGHSGHATTFSLACKLARRGLMEQEIEFYLTQYHNPKCQPAWSARELRHKANQAFKKARSA